MAKQHFIIALLCSIVSLSCFGQTAREQKKDPVPYEVRYKKLKELQLKEMDSKSHIVADSLFQLFQYKLTSDMELDEIEVENFDYIPWVKDNLSKTEFKDVAEAERLWAAYEEAVDTGIIENKEYYDYLMETFSYENGIELHVKVMSDVFEEYPEKHKTIKLPERKKKSDFYPKIPGQ